MVGWHHRLDGHEFEQAPGDSEGQGGLAHCGPWGRKELNMTEWLNNKFLEHQGALGSTLHHTFGSLMLRGRWERSVGGASLPPEAATPEWLRAQSDVKPTSVYKGKVVSCCCFSAAQSCLTLRPHGLQRTRPPCPAPAPGVCSSSCPSSR